MKVKVLRIVKAKDQLMWYAGLVGQLVPYLGQWPEAYKSREPAGYINMVHFCDAEIVEVEDAPSSGAKAQAVAP